MKILNVKIDENVYTAIEDLKADFEENRIVITNSSIEDNTYNFYFANIELLVDFIDRCTYYYRVNSFSGIFIN